MDINAGNTIRAELMKDVWIKTAYEPFDVFDKMGREIGHMAAITLTRWEADETSSRLLPPDRVGVDLYKVEPRACRDGYSFGAIPVRSTKFFPTLGEAVDHANALIAKKRREAQRKYAN
jgi:hypothetical protein